MTEGNPCRTDGAAPEACGAPSISNYLRFDRLLLDQKQLFKETASMSVSLDALERRIDELLSVCDALHADNDLLRLRINVLESDKEVLSKKIDTAATRLEALMEQLPAE